MYTTEKKTLKVGKLVNTEHVDTVIRNYKKERWVHNSKRLGKDDSLSAWYSVEELEEYLEKVKAHGGDGIRIYFAAYDLDYKEKPLYAGRQTVVLVGTKHRENETGATNKDIYISTDQGTSILAYNASTICPPMCSAGDGFDIGITILDRGDGDVVVA